MSQLILFQGDSITDAGRSRTDDYNLGAGYPVLLSARLGRDYGTKYSIINRGISGNRVVDLYARWKIDCINLAPDIISILIGVNDVWHELMNKNGVDAAKFERVYNMLLEETREALPHTRIMVLEPFVLLGHNTQEHWDYFRDEVTLRAQAARRVAKNAGATFVPLQDVLEEAATKAPAEHWLSDGVHPTPAGHQLIADAWMQAFAHMNT